MFDFFNDDVFTPEEQVELAIYFDERLEKTELLLGQMKELAELAASEVSARKRGQLQKELTELEREIDRIAEELPVTYKFPDGM